MSTSKVRSYTHKYDDRYSFRLYVNECKGFIKLYVDDTQVQHTAYKFAIGRIGLLPDVFVMSCEMLSKAFEEKFKNVVLPPYDREDSFWTREKLEMSISIPDRNKSLTFSRGFILERKNATIRRVKMIHYLREIVDLLESGKDLKEVEPFNHKIQERLMDWVYGYIDKKYLNSVTRMFAEITSGKEEMEPESLVDNE